MRRRHSLIALLGLVIGVASADSVETFEQRHRASIATDEGRAYESVASNRFRSDLGFLPKCIRRTGVGSGAMTIYYAIDEDGRITELFFTPDSALVECVRDEIETRRFPPAPPDWVGKITLTISR